VEGADEWVGPKFNTGEKGVASTGLTRERGDPWFSKKEPTVFGFGVCGKGVVERLLKKKFNTQKLE